MKKTHVIFSSLFLGILVAMNLSTSLRASPDDQIAYVKSDKEVLRVTGDGGVISSSGIRVESGMQIQSETWIDLPRPSNTYILNPGVFLDSSTALSSTTLSNGATTYLWSNPLLRQPDVPRTISFELLWASGSIVIFGTNSFNVPVREEIMIGSGGLVTSNYAYVGISSFTLFITSVGISCSTITFRVGTSSEVALPFDIDFASDVYMVRENNVARSTYTAVPGLVNINKNTISFNANTADGVKDFKVWAFLRQTLFGPPKQR